MPRKKLNTRDFIKQTIIVGLIGFPVGFLFCGSCLNELEWALKTGTFSASLWILMWQGNALVSDYISRKIPWLENPRKRLLWGVVGILVYTPLAMMFVNFFFSWLWDIDTGMTRSFSGFLNTIGIAVGITVLISLVLNAMSFFSAWRQTAINAEKLKRESLKSQFEALKAQINPHFLFNSLNVLSGLVYKDPDESAKFIKQLSKVYRYLLDKQDKEIVDIDEELDFINSFVFLNKIRFSENLVVDIQIEDFAFKVPPLALQILIENAIKHNEISKENPLVITVEDDSEYVTVSNPMRRKNRPLNQSPNIGLSNLKERYIYLTNKDVLISEEDGNFRVSIPKILKVYESSHT